MNCNLLKTIVRWTQIKIHSSNFDTIQINPFKNDSMSLGFIDQIFLVMCQVGQGLQEEYISVNFNVFQAVLKNIHKVQSGDRKRG